MAHTSAIHPGNGVSRCDGLVNGHFNLRRHSYECIVCPFLVSGRQGIHVFATVTIHSPTPRTSPYIEVVCEGVHESVGWSRSYRYERHGMTAGVNVFMCNDREMHPMPPGTYQLGFRLQVPQPGVSISATGRVAFR